MNSIRGTGSAPDDAYTTRALEAQRVEALKTWSSKTFRWCLAELVATGLMLYSRYWYLSMWGLLLVFLGVYGTKRQKNEFLFIYLVLAICCMIKDGAIVYLYLHGNKPQGYAGLVVTVAILDGVVLLPALFYHGFYLYQSMLANLTFEKVTEE